MFGNKAKHCMYYVTVDHKKCLRLNTYHVLKELIF